MDARKLQYLLFSSDTLPSYHIKNVPKEPPKKHDGFAKHYGPDGSQGQAQKVNAEVIRKCFTPKTCISNTNTVTE